MVLHFGTDMAMVLAIVVFFSRCGTIGRINICNYELLLILVQVSLLVLSLVRITDFNKVMS